MGLAHLLGKRMMILMDGFSKLLLAPSASGRRALIYTFLLLAIPTGLRLILDAMLGSSLSFLIYMPFVIIGAIVLRWPYAAAVVLGAWTTANILFVSPRYEFGFERVEEISFIVLLVSAVLLIALVEAVRTIVENSLRPARPDGSFSTPVVFSLDRGQAWASWYGSHSWVRLGPEEEVAECMRDFLAQRALAKRLGEKAEPEMSGNP